MALTTLSAIYEAARAAASTLDISIYIGRITDYATSGNVAQLDDPILVIEFPTGSASPTQRGSAIRTTYDVRGYMLTSDDENSGADTVLETNFAIPARQTSIEAMDLLMTQWVFAFRSEVEAIGGEFTSAGSGQTYDRFTSNTKVGVGRTFGVAIVNTSCDND